MTSKLDRALELMDTIDSFLNRDSMFLIEEEFNELYTILREMKDNDEAI